MRPDGATCVLSVVDVYSSSSSSSQVLRDQLRVQVLNHIRMLPTLQANMGVDDSSDAVLVATATAADAAPRADAAALSLHNNFGSPAHQRDLCDAVVFRDLYAEARNLVSSYGAILHTRVYNLVHALGCGDNGTTAMTAPYGRIARRRRLEHPICYGGSHEGVCLVKRCIASCLERRRRTRKPPTDGRTNDRPTQ